MLGWTWPSRKQSIPPNPGVRGGRPDGEENVQRGRHHRDPGPLARGAEATPRSLPSLNVDRKTVRKYVAVAEAAGMVPGGPPLSEAEWDAKAREWFPELADTRLRQVTWPAIEPHHEFIGGS